MKKILHMGMCILTMLLLTGCAKFEPQEDAVSVGKDGKIVRAFVDEFVDGSNQPYNTEEIAAMMQQELDTYNKKFGVEHIVMKKCELENGKLNLQIECDDAKYYKDYCSYYNDDFSTEEADVEFFVGAVADAVEYGLEEAAFTNPQGEAVDMSVIKDQGYCQTVVLNEPIEVYVPGKILYASGNVEILGDKHARVTAGEEQELQKAFIIYK